MCSDKSHLKYVLHGSSEICYHRIHKKRKEKKEKKEEGKNSGAKGTDKGGKSVPDLSTFFCYGTYLHQ